MRGRPRIESSTLAWIALASLLLIGAALLLRETRDTALWFDEWVWVQDRRGNSLGTFLESHNGHFSLVPVVLYKLLFATAGLDHYLPYRVMVTAAHVLCVVLVFVYARRRVGEWAALIPAVLLFTLGPAWQNFIWPFQVAWLVSLAAAVGALLLLDRDDRRGEIGASALLALALASSGLGIPIAAGLLVEVVARRRSWWVVVAPVAAYGLWWLFYQDSGDFFRHNAVLAAQFAADAAAGALASLLGLTEGHFDSRGTLIDFGAALVWGRSLLAAGVVVLVWRLLALGHVPIRVLSLLAMAATFWLLSGVQRVGIASPDSSRYLYVGGLLILLVAVELMRRVRVSRGVAVFIVAATAVVAVSNLGDLRAGARYLRSQALIGRADLGVLELARAQLPPGYHAARFPGVPFLELDAREYLAAASQLGSPALTPEQIATVPNIEARFAADGELANIERVVPRPSTARAGSAPPVVDAAHGGQVRISGGCVRFHADAATAPGGVTELQLTVPLAGLQLTAEGVPASVALRRFANVFPREPEARLAPGRPAELRPPRDRVSQPWHVRVSTPAGVRACGLRQGG